MSKRTKIKTIPTERAEPAEELARVMRAPRLAPEITERIFKLIEVHHPATRNARSSRAAESEHVFAQFR